MPAARALGFPTPSSRGVTGSLSASLPSAALDIHARYAMMQRQQQVSWLRSKHIFCPLFKKLFILLPLIPLWYGLFLMVWTLPAPAPPCDARCLSM